MTNESMKRVAINRLSMEPSRIIKAILEPDYPHAHLEWNVTGEGIEITPMERQCVVEPIDFDGDSAKATVTATIPDSPSFVGTSASCDVTVVKQPTAIQLSAVGAPGGYMVTVVQSAESYSRVWKLDAGDVYQGDVCDESGGWQPLPEDGIIDAQSGVLTVVDVDSSHGARRAGSVMLQSSANLACYGPVDVTDGYMGASVASDGGLHVTGTHQAWNSLHYPLTDAVAEHIKGRTVTMSRDLTNDQMANCRVVVVYDGKETEFLDFEDLSHSFTVPDDVESIAVLLQPSSAGDADFTVHLGLWEGDASQTEWAPGIITRGGVSETRPNLWPVMKAPVTLGGVTFTPNGAGSVTVDGESAATYPAISVSTVLLPGTYLVRPTRVEGLYTQAKWLGEVLSTADGRDGRFTLDSECTVTLQVVCSPNKTFDQVTLTPFLHAESAGGGVSDKRPNLLTYVDLTVEGGVLTVNGDGSFDLTVTDWPQWRNMVFYLPEGTLVAGRTYTLSVQEPYETPTVNMHVRTGGSGHGPLKLTYGKSSVTATPDAISITPNLTIINEKPDPTSGSLRNVRLKLEEGGEPTGWVPPVFSGGV